MYKKIQLFVMLNFGLCFFCYGQNDKQQALLQLKNLRDDEFISKCLEFGRLNLTKNNLDDAIYYFEKAADKYSDSHNSTEVALFEYDLASLFKFKTLGEEPSNIVLGFIEKSLKYLSTNEHYFNIYDLSTNIKFYKGKKFDKRLQHIIDKTKIEFEKIAVEKERLKMNARVSNLENAKDELLKRQKNTEIMLSAMNKENLIKEALLEKQKRSIDSMQYKNIIDSISIQSKNFEITQQAAELNLQKTKSTLILTLTCLAILASLVIYYRFVTVAKKNKIIETEKQHSDKLLLNILPYEVAMELKMNGKVAAQYFDNSSILFTDFVNFSGLSKKLSPQQLVNDLDYCFSHFDQIVNKYGIEKIKTIGDSYMCIAGVPLPIVNHAELVTHVGLEILEFLREWNLERKAKRLDPYEIRIGIHSGPVAAGVVGSSKFVFDVWGEAVNIASRMESSADVGRINISESTYQLIKNSFQCESRGVLKIKNMPEMSMYFVREKI